MPSLSSLKRVDLREVWPHEASDFTPWLEDNIEVLGEVLGLDLEVETREASVGPFSLDLLARDLGSNRRVVIENQLDATNHDHLGKLLTYAAGFDASVVVWLVREFRPEHRAALDWLNHRTEEDTAFFGVVVEAWKIDDSNPAPQLVAIAMPNDWQKEVASRATGGEASNLSERRIRYRDFYQQLLDTLREKHQFTRARKAQPQNWYSFASGFAGISYSVGFTAENNARVEVTIATSDGKEVNERLFSQLKEVRESIEEDLGFALIWDPLANRKACRICVERPGEIDEDDDALADIQRWMVGNLLEIRRVFLPYLRELPF